VKFKIDENLPAEAAETLRKSGFVADTVADENLSGSEMKRSLPGVDRRSESW
jgi:hypothetical protein